MILYLAESVIVFGYNGYLNTKCYRQGFVNSMDHITGIEKKIEETIKAFEITLDSLFESQIKCKKEAKNYYPIKLDDNISEFERDIYCIIRRWNLLKENIRKMDQSKRESMINSLDPMQRSANKKLNDIVFELRSIDEISVGFSEDEYIADEWGEGKEWKEEDNDDDEFTY